MFFSHPFGSTAADLSAAISLSNKEAEEDAEFEFIFDSVFSVFQAPAVEAYVDNHCRVFEHVEENKLEYTEIFNGYKQLVDEQLLGVCSDLALTADRIDGFCHRCQKNTRGELQKAVMEKLLSVEDFETFKQVMINRKAELYPTSLVSDAMMISIVSGQRESPVSVTSVDAVAEVVAQKGIKPQNPTASSISHPPQADSLETVSLQPAGGHAAAAAAAMARSLVSEAHLQGGSFVMPTDDAAPASARISSRPLQVDSLEASPMQPTSHAVGGHAAVAMLQVPQAKEVNKGNDGRSSVVLADDTMPAFAPVDFMPKPWPTKVSFAAAPLLQPATHEENCQARAEYWRKQRDLILQKKAAGNHAIVASREASGDAHIPSRKTIEGQRLVEELSGRLKGSPEAAEAGQGADAMRRALLRQLRSTFQT